MIYPRVCPFCEEIEKAGICSSCRKTLKYIKGAYCYSCGRSMHALEQEYCRDCQKKNFAYDQGRSLWLHQGQVAHAIYQFKFHNKRDFGRIFAMELNREFVATIKAWGIEEIIPIPLHATKQKSRGYNQSAVIADYLGEMWDLPVNHNKVFRICKTKPQKTLDAKGRIENLKHAFGVSKKEQVYKNILLIDDIYTTGSTIHQVAKLLKIGGAKKVYFLSVSIGQGL
ncbi:MAG: ComF family protein [Lachnospiraceae bacterium]|nr:ComF family protein [Lachnospiraceae bacterium]